MQAAGPSTASVPPAVRTRVAAQAMLLHILGPANVSVVPPWPVAPGCLRRLPFADELHPPSPVTTGTSPAQEAAADAPVRELRWSALQGEATPGTGTGDTWCERLWSAGTPSDAVAREVTSRRFYADHVDAKALPRLEGARWIESPEAFDLALANLPAWVLKAPFSTSGRGRVLATKATPKDAARTQGHALLARSSGAYLEPWCDRIADGGGWGLVTADGCLVGDVHHLEVDGGGRFTGIRHASNTTNSPAVGALLGAIHTALPTVGRLLQQAGYVGPFGIDGFAYRDAAGATRLHPVCEINARMTFGLVAAVWFERVAAAGLPYQALRFGTRPQHDASELWCPLLGSPDGREAWAWLEDLT